MIRNDEILNEATKGRPPRHFIYGGFFYKEAKQAQSTVLKYNKYLNETFLFTLYPYFNNYFPVISHDIRANSVG